jgi:hypothetical protein
MTPSWPAHYAGRCRACDDPIDPGDAVTWSDVGGDGELVTVHEGCATAVRPPEPTETCPRCFMVKARNGACGCD